MEYRNERERVQHQRIDRLTATCARVAHMYGSGWPAVAQAIADGHVRMEPIDEILLECASAARRELVRMSRVAKIQNSMYGPLDHYADQRDPYVRMVRLAVA